MFDYVDYFEKKNKSFCWLSYAYSIIFVGTFFYKVDEYITCTYFLTCL